MNTKFLIIFLAFLVFFSFVIYAAPLPPSPVCEIEAEIINIRISKNVDIKVLFIGEMIEEGLQLLYENFSCQEYEDDLIDDVSMWTEGNYKSGQTIRAEISYVGDEFSHGHVLNNVIILTEPDRGNNMNILYYLIPIILILVLWLIIKKKRLGS